MGKVLIMGDVFIYSEGQAEINIHTDARHHHSAGSMHGQF